MRLFQLILQNKSSQRIVRNVLETISNNDDGDISVTVKHFLHSIMDAIGFNYYVSMDEISNRAFQWPVSRAISYQFKYEASKFERYGTFLKEICRAMHHEEMFDHLQEIIDTFLKLCDSAEEQWRDNFVEPFSLISFSFLTALNKIRTNESETSLILDHLCHRLFQKSEEGLGFLDSHKIIVKGMSKLLANDYYHFSHDDESVFNFYMKCFEYEMSSAGGQLFVEMRNAIENEQAPREERDNLVKFLTDPKMIKAYCVFADHFSGFKLVSLLNFLNSLLVHLPILECFSRQQVHTIFSNAFNDNKKVRFEAVKFYIGFMTKSFANKVIFKDILDFFLNEAHGVEKLDKFIESLWNEFPYMTDFKQYLKILSKTEWNTNILSVTAQFLYHVFQRMSIESKNNDEYSNRLSSLYLKLPALLIVLEDNWQITGLLLNIYSATDPEEAKISIKFFPIAADSFIKYALKYLAKENIDKAVVQNMVYSMLKMMDSFNKQDEMEQFANGVFSKFKELLSCGTELSEDQVGKMENKLTMLSCITDTCSALNEEHLINLLSALRTWLIDSNVFQELSIKYKCSLDSLAITTYSGCLNILSVMFAQITPDGSNIESETLIIHVNSFLSYLLQRLEDALQCSIEFAEAAIRALCELYMVFNFKLAGSVYHTLVNSVIKYVFTTSTSTVQPRILELKKNILHSFNLLHKIVEIPKAITWKIIAYFGMEPIFDTEITELMDILYEYNSEKCRKPSLYTYVVPVAIYNLFQSKAPLKKFQKVIKAHKNYIEDKIPSNTQRSVKAHIVLTIIDMIEKSIHTGQIRQQTNRIELLSNMNILLNDVYRNEFNLILRQSRRLERHSLTHDERRSLSSFQQQLA